MRAFQRVKVDSGSDWGWRDWLTTRDLAAPLAAL